MILLQRWGQLQNQSFGLMDDLSYAHNGNQVQQVNDAIINGGVKDFAEAGTNLTVEYLYDASGNMVEDKNKGILINYNHLNLPTVINFNNGNSIRYVYLADGTKIQKLAENTSTNTTTVSDYVGGIHYEGGHLQFFQHEEGRTIFNGEMYTNEYNYKDHLGNTRLSFSDLNFDGDINLNTEVLQTTDYYPFGLEHTNNSHVQVGPKNQYLYNGKEMQSDFGLDWYDYGARFYNPSIGLWGQVDPLAESMSSFSVYNYGFNNPLRFIDPTGMAPEESTSDLVNRLWNSGESGTFDNKGNKVGGNGNEGGDGKKKDGNEGGDKGDNCSNEDNCSSEDKAEQQYAPLAQGPKYNQNDDYFSWFHTGKREWTDPKTGVTYEIDDEGNVVGIAPIKFELPWTPGNGVKVLKNVDNIKKTVVIGENMLERVIPYAKKYGFKYFKPRGKNPANYMHNQIQWMRRQLKDTGTRILDYGPEGLTPNSKYYKKELEMILKWLENL